MALETLTSTKASVTRTVVRDGPPNLLAEALQIDGNESFSAADLTEPDGVTGWLVHPATCDHGVAFEVTFNCKTLLPGTYSTTLRATSGLVVCNIPITLQVLAGGFKSKGGRA